MVGTTLHIIDLLLWLFMAASVMYVVFFAVASLFKFSPTTHHASLTTHHSFLVLFPAYNEDAVIVHSVMKFLKSEYPKDLYHVAVISDHMTDETNQKLESLPITLLQPVFDKSSKARALQYAIDHVSDNVRADYVVILDADNVVKPDFLTRLNETCATGYKAIQCHRCAKNANNDVAVLDGVSEEINNTIFRRAHNVIGMSSALIGSGMCFDFQWFKEHVGLLNSAVEDRELEAMLMKERIFIKFENDIPVYDEKVSNSDNFQRQRLRWMNGQFQTLLFMLPYLPQAFLTGNINYIDKTIQQALIPRSILLVLTLTLTIIITILTLTTHYSPLTTLMWWGLFILLCLSLFIAMPSRLRKQAVFSRLVHLPRLVWHMFSNVLKIDHKNKDFIHTTHG
jgi:cellulose synthase/poly-beta-1,6-N-acetylglucosamine synthase-like glycosyltransferase